MTRQSAEAAWIRSYARGRPSLELPEHLPRHGGADRAGMDARAAWNRWHDAQCRALFGPEQWPWYLILEQARTDTLASRELPGISLNLSLPQTLDEQSNPSVLLYRIARKCLSGQETDLEAERAEIRKRRSIWKRLSRRIRAEDRAQEMIDRLDIDTIVSRLTAGRTDLENTLLFARRIRPVVRHLTGEVKHPDEAELLEEQDAPSGDALENAADQDETAEDFGGEQAVPEIVRRFPDYRVLTTDFDEIGPAQRWYRDRDSEALQQLDRLDRRAARRLAHRLQRQLQRLRLRRWSFDQEEGLLDARRLARLVGDRPDRRVFRIESQSQVPEAAITFLVDQSGSMRGEAHQLAAQALDLAVHTLEVCGLSTEVLGYTTVAGQQDHNPVTERWRQSGSPPSPGRLNALRHIILKSSNQPWRRARRYLGLLLRADFGRENIDGESLYWAHQRLLARSEARRVLIVLCDGVPYDQVTVEANGKSLLVDHLRAVIDSIEAGPVHLLAVGTGRDVSRHYRNSVIVRKPEQIAEMLFSGIADALELEA